MPAYQFNDKDTADMIRSEYQPHLCGSDDQRQKTVVISDEASSDVKTAVQNTAPTMGDECDHDNNHCKHGNAEMHEFLHDECGYSDAMTGDLLAGETPPETNMSDSDAMMMNDTSSNRESAGNDTESSDNQEIDMPDDQQPDAGQPALNAGPVGAADDMDMSQLSADERREYSDSVKQYYTAINQLEDSIENYFKPYWSDAQTSADQIQAIRLANGKDRQHFERLEDIQGRLLDFLRVMAEDCMECHASHDDHNHEVTDGMREDIRKFIYAGATATPVGASEETEAAADEAMS